MHFPDAIIFDLDDTILDDSGGVDTCWREVCSTASSELEGVGLDALLVAIGR
jgi:beta-phosphoglucomutase-like phosphatase (HAD superfamily)